MRTGDSPQTFVLKAPLPDTAPVPTIAIWRGDFQGIEVRFNKDLKDVPLSAANWRLHVFERRRRLLFPAVVFGNQVRSQTAPFGLFIFDNFVQYLAAPPDLVGVNNIPVAPFDGFPVDIAPP